MYKIILDKLLFGGVSAFVGLEPIKKHFRHLYHIAFGALRKKVREEGFIYSDYWTYDKHGREVSAGYLPRERTEYQLYKKLKQSGLKIHLDYTPGLRVYPQPEYRGAVTAIETDVEINRFHMNNTKSGFSAGQLIEIIGAAGEGEQVEFEEQFKEKYTGSLNAGELLIVHSPREDMGVKVHQMRPNDLDKQYLETAKKVQQDIFIGHRVTSPFIFGVKTEGQLGGKQEMQDAMAEFQAKYIEPNQRWAASFINDLIFESYGFDPLLKIVPLDTGEDVQNDTESEAADNKVNLSANKEAEILEGLKKKGVKKSDYEVIKEVEIDPEMTEINEEFEANLIENVVNLQLSVSAIDMVLMQYLQQNKGVTMKQLAGRFGLNEYLLERSLANLSKNNMLAWRLGKDGQIIADKFQPFNNPENVVRQQINEPEMLVTMFSYTGPNDEKTRAFCKSMLELDRMWERKEIDTLSAELGYSVWESCGGWYTIPNSGTPPIRRPKCRHIWKAMVVKKKMN
jgi:hypothetical protein